MKRESNPARYSELAIAVDREVAEARITAFMDAVAGLRADYMIADVHLVCRVMVKIEDEEAPVMSVAHYGAVQESEGMCAYAFAAAAERRTRYVDHQKAQGKRIAQS